MTTLKEEDPRDLRDEIDGPKGLSHDLWLEKKAEEEEERLAKL